MLVIGIDPGKTGAMALLYADGSVEVLDVPLQKLNGKEVPAWSAWAVEWAEAMRSAQPDMVVIEKVAARPGQGVTSMFNFGVTLGFVRAIAYASGAQVVEVAPATWKAKLGLLQSGKGASREKASALIPEMRPHVTRAKDDGRAEAALLAYYGKKYA